MFSPEEIDSICSITASLLHLGNIMFVNDPEKDVWWTLLTAQSSRPPPRSSGLRQTTSLTR